MSNFGGGGDIPSGDKLRATQTTVIATTETTVFTRSGKGFISELNIQSFAANPTLTSLKVTIDGAAERELLSTSMFVQQNGFNKIPVAISYKTACTIKYTANILTYATVFNYEE
jgi:hypothetical protein